jgi:uncharacterized membrane protein
VLAPGDGYLAYIDEQAFAGLEGASLACIQVRVGDYVREEEVVARVWGGSVSDDAGEALARAFEIQKERTIRQDLEFGFRMIVDVAVRALSPGINDPTTAVYCVNTLSGLLCNAARRKFPDRLRTMEPGLVIHAPRPAFAELARLSFKQIIHHGRDDYYVMNAVLAALEALAARDALQHHGPVIAELAEHLVTAVTPGNLWPARDRHATLARARQVLASVAAEAARARREGGG